MVRCDPNAVERRRSSRPALGRDPAGRIGDRRSVFSGDARVAVEAGSRERIAGTRRTSYPAEDWRRAPSEGRRQTLGQNDGQNHGETRGADAGVTHGSTTAAGTRRKAGPAKSLARRTW